MESDLESRNFQERSERRLSPVFFHKTYHRSFCISNFPPTSSLHGLKTRLRKLSNKCKCNAKVLGQNVPICISPIYPNFSSFIKAQESKNYNDLSYIDIVNTSMVYNGSKYVSVPPIFAATSKGLSFGSIRKSSATNKESHIKSGGLSGFRKSLATRDISEKATKLISNSRRMSSVSSYEWNCRL